MGDGECRLNAAETVFALVALCTWYKTLQGCCINVWVDSSTTRGVITNGYSKTKVLAHVSAEIWLIAERLQCGLLVHCVPTHLNQANPLSRGDDTIAVLNGFERVSPRYVPRHLWRL
jgi:hypothetical protein